MARKSIAKKKANVDEKSVTFTFSDGNERVVKLDELPKDVVNYATLHGLLQGLGDAYAGAESPEDGLKALNARIEKWVETGIWATRGSGGGSTRVTIFHQALFNVMEGSENPKTLEEIQEMLSEKTDDQVKELKAHSQVRAAIAKINAQNAAKKAKDAAKEVGGEEEAPLTF